MRVFGALSDDSLAQSVKPGGYTLGWVAAHLTNSILGIPAHAGLVAPPAGGTLATVAEIVSAYEHNTKLVADAVQEKWSNEQLGEEVPAFGQSFRRGAILGLLVAHQAHHRGEMMVLMHQAGLKVPGVYGPSADDKTTK